MLGISERSEAQFDHLQIQEQKKIRGSLGILNKIFGSRCFSQQTPSKSRRFACTRSELFQNRASRVDGKLCFGTGKTEIYPGPGADMPQPQPQPREGSQGGPHGRSFKPKNLRRMKRAHACPQTPKVLKSVEFSTFPAPKHAFCLGI